MKSFVVMTYYQLMHSIAMTLDLGEKTNLYFHMNYLNVEENFLDRIRETNIFNEVVGLQQDEFITPFIEDLKTTSGMSESEIKGIGSSIFEKHLTPYYEQQFINADKDDFIYVYNDFQWHYYYIDKAFNKIISVEDGYGSLKQQMEVHSFKGNHQLVEPFLGEYYPEPLYKSKNVQKIISSFEFDDIPEYYKEKLELINFKELMNQNKERFLNVMEKIFALEDLEIMDDSVLILGTPLARAKYCTAEQGYLFYRKLIQECIEENPDSHIYIKPHPADTLQYEMFENEKVTVLDKAFPIELLEYRGKRFKKTISFGSTAVLDKLSDNNEIMYTGEVTVEGVKRHIKRYIKKESLLFKIYIVINSIDEETAVNVLSYLREYEGFDIRIELIVNSNIYDKSKRLFETNNIKATVNDYLKLRKGTIERGFYNNEIKALKRISIDDVVKHGKLKIVPLESCNEQDIYQRIIKNDTFDFCLMVNGNNLGSYVLDKTITAMKRNAVFMQSFINYMNRTKEGNKLLLGFRCCGDYYIDTLYNRIYHKKTFEKADTLGISIPELLYYNKTYTVKRAILRLNVDQDIYTGILYGKKYYCQKIEELFQGHLDDKTYICGKASGYLYEYYNWTRLNSPQLIAGTVSEFMDKLCIPVEYKAQILENFTESLVFEKRTDETRLLYKDIQIYGYSKRIIDKSIKLGLVSMIKFIVNIKKSVVSKLRVKK